MSKVMPSKSIVSEFPKVYQTFCGTIFIASNLLYGIFFLNMLVG
jgi:hypothetical protein